MSKTNVKSVQDQIIDQLPPQKEVGDDLAPEFTQTQLLIAAARGVNLLSQGADGQDPLTIPVSAASINAGVSDAMGILAATFTQNVERRKVGDKTYALDRDLPPECEGEGEIVTVNTLAFTARVVMQGVVDKLEWLVENAEKRLAQQKGYIARLNRDEHTTEEAYQAADFFLGEREIEMGIALAGFDAAVVAFEDLTGTRYETRAMRLAAQRRERASAQAPRQSAAAARGFATSR